MQSDFGLGTLVGDACPEAAKVGRFVGVPLGGFSGDICRFLARVGVFRLLRALLLLRLALAFGFASLLRTALLREGVLVRFLALAGVFLAAFFLRAPPSTRV